MMNMFILCFKFKTDVFVFVMLVKSGNVKREGKKKTPQHFKFKSPKRKELHETGPSQTLVEYWIWDIDTEQGEQLDRQEVKLMNKYTHSAVTVP